MNDSPNQSFPELSFSSDTKFEDMSNICVSVRSVPTINKKEEYSVSLLL